MKLESLQDWIKTHTSEEVNEFLKQLHTHLDYDKACVNCAFARDNKAGKYICEKGVRQTSLVSNTADFFCCYFKDKK